ncbi:MAG: glycerol-3-phosphate dehydrogenase [Sphingomonadaceae bacterium]|nr:glycerol-3-phosphate dehydrogenase [Sphingomonadaceae bacterium]MCP5383271.1 glycerol-3-phosphate dehydrogenase [Altererythrobacter sp.]MCP5393448.1 glycerol-3-phosphate dehydrogenase [Sphingomonadaceae bacterium]
MDGAYDLLVIGGGINGAGIARDAAGRGAKVLLVEKDDLASHTSSASTKLVHGGLRYLEHYEFRLVRESLIERERLLGLAPHIIRPLRFVLPHDKGLRPKWMLRLGLFLYDHISGRKVLPPTSVVNLRDAPHAGVLEDRLITGYEYSDCWVEDARLVVLNALDAKERGADIRTRTECIGLERHADHWTARLRDTSGTESEITANVVVNAAGPWVDAVLGKAIPAERHQNLRLVKGSHLVFPKLYEHDRCYIFQNGDGRIVFAIPYEREFTLVGTTDVLFTGDADRIAISDEESRYICDAINEYLCVDVTPEQAVWSYAGVRPLYDDKSASNSTVTRDYVFELDDRGGAPILSIFGGKITTFRKLAEHALEKLGGLGGAAWTGDAVLPGGDMPAGGPADWLPAYEWAADRFGAATVERLLRAYGSRIEAIIGTQDNPADPGEQIAPGLFEAELHYLRNVEFAHSAEDVLWRRSKLGLHLPADAPAKIADWFAQTRT